MLSKYKNKVLQGGMLTRQEALQLVDAELQELSSAANEIRAYFCQNQVDLCCIINGSIYIVGCTCTPIWLYAHRMGCSHMQISNG